jgi:hypothetical protein
MHNLLIPVLILMVLPALYGGQRLGLWRRRGWRWIGGGMLVLVVALSMPFGGVDIESGNRIKLFLACGTFLVLLLRYARFSWFADTTRYRATLTAIAVLAVVTHLNFFSFHGQRTFVHLHDVAHYYLGSKYFAELGYRDLYTAMLRAEAESYDNHFKAIEARDLESYDRVHIRALLQKSDRVKAAFTPERWSDFKLDVGYFRNALDRQYGKVLLDHGFNPTPVWVVFGSVLSSWVPAGSETGILMLTLLDPLLLIGLFLAVAWAFGREATLLSVIHFCVIFGASFAWTGGAFLRYPWLAAAVIGSCFLRRRHYKAAGVLFALATMLRVFPVLFVVPLAMRAATVAVAGRSVPRRYFDFFVSYAAAACMLVAVTGFLPRRFGNWIEFRANLSTHVRQISPNVVGLTKVLAHIPGAPEEVSQEDFDALKTRQQRIYHIQLAVVFVPALLLMAGVSRRTSDVGTILIALPLLFFGLNLASYYYIFLILVAAHLWRFPGRVAQLFGVEAATYCLLLFEDREGLLFVYRSLLVLYLVVALYSDSVVRELTRLRVRLAALRSV